MPRINQRITLLFLLWVLIPAGTYAEELTNDVFNAAIKDIKLLLTNAPLTTLSVLKTEVKGTHVVAQLSNARYGQIHIKQKINTELTTVIQIPHKHHDLHTQKIGEQFFTQPTVDIAMYNGEQRYSSPNADLTHLKQSLFTALAEAMKQLKRAGRIIQIHGFAAEKRQTVTAQQADVILSNGTAYPFPFMHKIQICLRDNAKILARLYGRDVFELGATTNQVAKRLKTRSDQFNTQFLHIELSDALREQWINEAIKEEVLQCMLQ